MSVNKRPASYKFFLLVNRHPDFYLSSNWDLYAWVGGRKGAYLVDFKNYETARICIKLYIPNFNYDDE